MDGKIHLEVFIIRLHVSDLDKNLEYTVEQIDIILGYKKLEMTNLTQN